MKKPFDNKLLIDKVAKTIDSNHLLDYGDRVLVGVSGGPDSMCLLDILQKLSIERCYSIEVAHVNHLLRGESSKSDQDFVESYCKKNSIQFYSCEINVNEFSKKNSMGIEEAARFVRYRYFNECAAGLDSKIAVAHHQQDQVETILMNLVRGCGLDGMTGIDYCAGNIIRPLLDCTRKEIDDYISFNEIPFCIDHTNNELCADRNKVRLELLPFFKKLFGRDISTAILKTRVLCDQDAAYLENVSKNLFLSSFNDGAIPCETLINMNVAISSRVIRHLYEAVKGDKKNLSFIQTESIMHIVKNKKEESAINLSDGLCAFISNQKLHIMKLNEYKKIVLQKTNVINDQKSIAIPLEIPIEHYEKKIKMFIFAKFVENPKEVDYNAMARCFSYETVKDAMWRYRKEGDWIQPNRNSGRKTIKKYFIDEKIPRDKRDSLLFLAKGPEVLWIPEYKGGQSDMGSISEPVDIDSKQSDFMKYVYIKVEYRS